MNKKELIMLSMLRKDSRMSLVEISKKTGIPVSTLYDKLRAFKGDIIRKNAALINFSRLGYVVRSHMTLAVDRSQKEEFAAFLFKSENVNTLYRINNGFDFFAEVLHRDINEHERFMDELQGKFKLKDKKVFFIIEEIKRESFLSEA